MRKQSERARQREEDDDDEDEFEEPAENEQGAWVEVIDIGLSISILCAALLAQLLRSASQREHHLGGDSGFVREASSASGEPRGHDSALQGCAASNSATAG